MQKRTAHYSSILVLLICATSVNAQNTGSISLSVQRSFTGTGDLNGYSFDVGYEKRIKKGIFNYFVEVGASLHDGQDEFHHNRLNNEQIDGSVRYTTGGFQLVPGISTNLRIKKFHVLQFGLGCIGRYQTSSLFNVRDTYYPIVTSVPYPLHGFVQEDPMRNISFGGKLFSRYTYLLNNSFSIGVIGSFQIDTNGDNIGGYGISIGKILH